MGGINSGRKGNRIPVENFYRLDVYHLNRNGLLNTGQQCRVTWSGDDGITTLAATIVTGNESITLEIDGQEQTIDIDYYRSGFGGRTPLFSIGGHRSRYAYFIPEWGRFAARNEFNSMWYSETQSPADRARHRAVKLRKRLGLPTIYPDMYESVKSHQKPKGMHWRTFWSTVAEIERQLSLYLNATATKVHRLS